MAHIEYITKYVRRWKNTQKYAERLTRALNDLTQEGWEVTITETEPTGTLIIARRMSKTALDELREHLSMSPLMIALGGPGPQPQGPGLTREAAEFLGGILDQVGTEKEAALKKLPSVMTGACRRYSNDKLRDIIKNIREYRDHHVQADHGGSACSLAYIIDAIIEHTDRAVQASVC